MDSREVKIEQMDTGNEPTSPLGPLDPSRLRDMVVDQQHFPSQHHPPNVMPAGQMSWQSEQTMRPTHMQGIPMDVQQTSQGPPQSTPQGPIPPQSPMGSPAQMSMNPSHNPQSQQPQGYDALPGYPPHQQHQPPYQMPPQSPSGAQMPPTAGPMPSPGNPMYQQRMMQMQGQSIHPQQYPLYPQNGQWPQPGTAYPQGGPRVAAQPQGMPQQRPMPIHRVPFPGGPGYPAGVPQGAAFRGAPTRPGQYPPGAAPPGYGYPGQPSQGYPPQGIPAAYQRPPQSQPMRPYINSPQTAMMGANVFPNVPQTPQTPNAHPYTPNGRGFVGTTPSPHHFPTGDMRSPLMSPPQATISRPLSSADMTMNPQIRLPGPIPPQFTVRDPNINIPPDLCFVGCCIQMVDSDKYTTDKSDMQNIANTIKLLGGDVDFGMKSFNEKLNVITHVVIDTARPSNQQMETILYQQAIPLKRRIVSMQWLVDAIAQKRMDVPWKAAHLPTFWRDIQRPHVGKVFAFAGFEPEERISLKFMVESIGGRATPYLSSQHSLLIAKTDSGGKVEKAREWNIPIVNYNWLQDVYFGKNNNVDLPQYQLGAPCSEVNTTGYALDALGDFNKNFLLGWRYPLLFDQQIFQRAQTVKHELEKDANVFPNMRYKEMFKNAPTEEQVDEAIARRKNNDQLDRRFVPRFSIAGFDDDLALAMSMKIRYLGGVMVVDVAKCTHFVTLNGKRTLSLLKAISVGAFVVRPEYIAASYEARCWQDSINFMMKDDESERLYGFNLKTSILKARRRKVFEKIRFFITPSVDPARLVLKRMIEVAGGEVDDEKPDVEEVMKRVDLDEPYIVIGAEADLRLVFYLLECNIPVYSPELILQSLVRQEFDASPSLRVIYPRSVPPVPQSSTSSQSTNQFQRPPPPTSATPQQPQTTTISNLPQRPSQSAHMTAAPVRG